MTVVDCLSLQPVAGPKPLDCGEDLFLEPLAAVKVRFFVPQFHEKLPHQRADRGVAFGGMNSGATVEVLGK